MKFDLRTSLGRMFAILLSVSALSVFAFERSSIAQINACDPSDPSCGPNDPSDPSDPDPKPCDPSQPNCTVSDAAIKKSATREAKKISNRLAGTYGKRENHNFNFMTAFKDEFSRGGNDPSQPGQSQSYEQGYREGLVAGEAFGANYGAQVVRSDANQIANSDVAARFRAVLDLDAMPDVRVRVPAIRFDGVDQNPGDDGFGSALRKLEEDFSYRLSRISWSYDGFRLSATERGIVTLKDAYADGRPRDYNFADGIFDSDDGFRSWLSGDFGGGYNTTLYRGLTTDQQKSLYRQTFRRSFEEVILEKYQYSKRRANREASDLGSRFGEGVRVARERSNGFVAGYRRAAKDASLRVYRASFAELYENAFNSTVAYYNTNAVLEITPSELTTRERFGVVPGATLSLSIQKASNLGRRAFDTDVAFRSNELEQIAQPVAVSIAASSTRNPAISIDRFGVVSARVKANTPVRVSFNFGAQAFNVETIVKWSSVISDFSSRSKTDPRYSMLSNYVIDQIRTEFLTAIKDDTNVYSRQSLLGDLVSQYSKMSSTDKANIKSLSSTISKISKEGGGFHPFIRSAYNNLASKIR